MCIRDSPEEAVAEVTEVVDVPQPLPATRIIRSLLGVVLLVALLLDGGLGPKLRLRLRRPT
eukprot:12817359-Alexandrium_andersonii.AAC.1